MPEGLTVFEGVKLFLIWMTPFVLIIGSLLLILSSKSYSSLEDKLARDLTGRRKKAIAVSVLDNNVNSLHNWLLAHKNLTGLVFILSSLFIFIFLQK